MRTDEARAFLELPAKAPISIAELKAAYKKACLKHHPDRNHGDEGATQRFQKVGEAFEILTRSLERDSSDTEEEEEDAKNEAGDAGSRGAGFGAGRPVYTDDEDSFSFETMFQEHYRRGMQCSSRNVSECVCTTRIARRSAS